MTSCGQRRPRLPCWPWFQASARPTLELVISSIVLAAGQSTRMGQPKALLDWGGEPLIAYQVKQLKEAGVDEVVVVLGYRSDDIHRKIGSLPCRVMLNARYQMGKANSLRIGAKAVDRDADA